MLRKKVIHTITVACALFAVTFELSAEVIELGADRDNCLIEYVEVEGNEPLSNGLGAWFHVGHTAASEFGRRRGLIHFNVAGSIPAGATINSAVLRLRMSKTNTSSPTNVLIGLHRLNANWGEGTSNATGNEGMGILATVGDATWFARFWSGVPENLQLWSVPGGDFVPTASAAILVPKPVGFRDWGSTPGMVADVQSWLNNPASNFGWLILGDETTQFTARRFDARNNTTTANRPKLTINYTPFVGCPQPADGDMNDDTLVDADDIQSFIGAILGSPTQTQICSGDFDNDTSLDADDVSGFVSALLQ